MVDIDKLQLLMLSIMQSMRATAPGTGLTLKELTKEVNKSNDRKYSQITISRKIWAMRDIGCKNYYRCSIRMRFINK